MSLDIKTQETENLINEYLQLSKDITDEINQLPIENYLEDEDMFNILEITHRHRNKEINNINKEKSKLKSSYMSAHSLIQKAVPLHEVILGERKPSSEYLPPGTSITRRKRWLEKYLQDVESGELDKKLIEQHHKVQKLRKKRSIASGVEGQSFANVSFLFLLYLSYSMF